MRAPTNRRVSVIGYAAATPLGAAFAASFDRAAAGEAGFRRITRCKVDCASDVVGEIPDWNPEELDFASPKDVHQWNAGFVLLTVAVCRDALRDAGLELTAGAARTRADRLGA